MTSDSIDWDLDKYDDGTFKIVGEVELRKYGNFLDDFADQLQTLQEALTGDSANQSWDITLDAISLYYFPTEQTSLVHLINTDNKVLNKVLLVLVSLCSEMSLLVQEARNTFYPALMFYGEGDLAENVGEAEAQVYMGQFIPVLQNLSCFVARVQKVTKNVVNQLAALHTRGPHRVMDLSNVHFQLVFEHLGDLLSSLVTLDYIINNQNTLQDHWTLYKRMIKAVRPNCAKFNIAPEKLKQFQKLLGKLESQIINANMFQNCVRQEFDEGQSIVSKNVGLSDEFIHNIRGYLWQVEAKLCEPTELDHRNRLVGICALYVLHFNIFRSADKKIFKQLWDTYKKVPAITLTGNVVFFIDKFLLEHLPQMMKILDKKAQSTVTSQQLNYLQNKAQTITRDAQTYYMQVALWLMKVESGLAVQGDVMEYLNKRSSILIQGLMIAYNISHTVKTIMNLQVTHNKPMTKTTVIALCKMIELLKAIQNTYHRYSLNIADSINHLVQHLCSVALNNIAMVKKRLLSDKKYNERHLDVISALMLVEQAINGPGTKERRLVTHLSLAVGIQMQSFQEDELSHLSLVLRKLDHICNLWEKMQLACDCSFLYWHRVVLPVYLDDVYSSGVDCHRIHYMFAALRDCAIAGSRSVFPELVTKSFDEEVFKSTKDHILDPLCQAVETDLRLQIHSHFQLDTRNPFEIGLTDLTPILAVKPIRFPGRFINIKAYVESYLDKTFYNLTTVALHDWKTYAEMRRLAEQKYGLYTVEAHLPSQTLEQGLDVLEIMRNINVFVSKYLYNLNNQIFVERSSNNKHLNAINIRHIANSIRTHGIGVINTTVNFTYQFLRKKFYIFSQFMYDEHIKSRLIKDIRYFKENKGSTGKKYSFERADKFNRGIRKLGVTGEGLSYLDQFRQLISHIGNAMGYIRMIRSGGLHCCSNAIRFIPDLEDIVTFEDLCKQESLTPDCQSAAAKLDEVISNLNKNFTEGTEYFKLLVDVFRPVFTNPQNIHLRNFYIILPPLTLNFIEHSITCKENMNRKNKLGAAFTDDGFAMGVAYILKLLDQYGEFDSLQWFQAVREKYRKEKSEVPPATGGRDDEKLQQTMTLTLKRLDMYQQEFDLLYYSLSSARIFFRADQHHHNAVVAQDKAFIPAL